MRIEMQARSMHQGSGPCTFWQQSISPRDRQDVGFCEQDGRPRGYGNDIAGRQEQGLTAHPHEHRQKQRPLVGDFFTGARLHTRQSEDHDAHNRRTHDSSDPICHPCFHAASLPGLLLRESHPGSLVGLLYRDSRPEASACSVIDASSTPTFHSAPYRTRGWLFPPSRLAHNEIPSN